MDPVTALGAAAAGAQFVGIAVKSLLGSAKLIRDVRDEPKRAVELLAWVDDEVTSMQTLLHPESLVFSHLTTNQYIQIAPQAIKARKAMEKVNHVLSPLVRDIESLKSRDEVGKRIMLVWKSILTLKSMKSIETALGMIRLLNLTLLRELQVCGLETQSILRNQSTQVLAIVGELSKRDEELHRSMEQINVSIAALAQTFATINSAGNVRYQEVLRMHMIQMAYLQAIQDKLSMTEVHPREDSEAHPGSPTESETSTVDVVKFHGATAKKGLRFPRCKCRSNMVSAIHKFGPFAYKTDRQAFQVCPLHRRIGQKSYSIEANLNPWANGLIQLSLGMLFQGKTWSILPKLKFQGTVRRSESPIFRLIDEFISSCSKVEMGTTWDGPGVLHDREGGMSVRFVWDSRKTKDCLTGVIRGINESTSAGLASCSDMDEQGCTLLTELISLFVRLGPDIFNVESEMAQLFQIASYSSLDSTKPLDVYQHRMATLPWYLYENPTMGETIMNSALDTGAIGASLYEVFMDYEGLVESTLHKDMVLQDLKSLWKPVTSMPSLAEALGCCDLSVAVISRSLERLQKQCYAQEVHSWKLSIFSPLWLAVGWPEGLLFLIQRNYGNVLAAFALACKTDDIKSARILLSAQAAVPFDPEDLNSSHGALIHFPFAQVLNLARSNLTIFRLAAEELWSRRDLITTTLLDYLKLDHRPDLLYTLARTATSPVRDYFEIPSPHRNKQAMAKILSSAVHMNVKFGSRHHQILFDVGFIDIDTWCGSKATTPLGFLCHRFSFNIVSGSREKNDWCSSILWLLRAGADPRLDAKYFRHDRYGRKQVQFCLAMAQNAGIKLAKEYVCTLGRRDERYLHDHCSCWCSSKGCIPSSRFWGDRRRRDSDIPNEKMQHLARITYRTRKWIRFWGYSRREKDFIQQEASRHEIFRRLGMKHSCCRAIFVPDDDDERRHIAQEDEESAHHLALLLRYYSFIKKVYLKIPIESFWVHWWDNIDIILPSIADIPSPQEEVNLGFKGLLVHKNDIENARDDRWRASLERAGYRNWDYQDVIRHHCTKMLLKARAYKEKEIAWKRHRLVTKPRFVRKRPSKSFNVQSEEEWLS